MCCRRWVYRQNESGKVEAVEVSSDWTDAPKASAPVSDLYMDGVRALDGADIGSRKKRREYMQAHGLADSSDFKETWAKAAKEREAFFAGQHDKQGRREDIERALYQQERARRK